MNYENALKKLETYGQTHLLKFYGGLSDGEREKLLAQIERLDFTPLLSLGKKNLPQETEAVFSPLPAMTVPEIDARKDEFRALGLKTLREGKTAAVLLAGGQGSRLGYEHAKGLYDIGITRPLSIFECLIRNLRKVTDEAGALIPLYIMTSEFNRAETEAFFLEHGFFGYDSAYVKFFTQEMAPCVGYDGRVLFENRHTVATSPNGNGGWFKSLQKAGLTDDMHRRGVEYVSAFSVDNVLQEINDPVFVGAAVASGTDVTAKVVKKAAPDERVGVICKKNGHPSIVEYYEMTDDMMTLRDEAGTLLYHYGVILNYLFKLSALEDAAAKKLSVHFAEKRIPYMNENGEFIAPEGNTHTGYKFEYLILDLVEFMDTCLPYEVLREKAFAPIKNRTGVDSVESARALLQKNGVEL